MKIRLKLLGDLQARLPQAERHEEARVDVADGCSLEELITGMNLPDDLETIALHNETLTTEANWPTIRLQDQDEVVLFTPIKGG